MSYEEKRVLVKIYGSLPASSPLLVDIPTMLGKAQQRLHKLAAEGLGVMAKAAASDLGLVLLGASGWRPHRWASREEYERRLIRQYGSVAQGRRFLAFDSPHETGLALDFGCGGLEPRSSTIVEQRRTPLFHWLVANAWKFGWHPYKVEPWHWEFPMSLEAYHSGDADEDDQHLEAPFDEE
jgi:LAS superfamily LD-carboxypeptidase LdcB